MSIYKACDIRGRFGSDLRGWHAQRLAQAICAFKGPSQVLVGGDGRETTPELKDALVDSFCQSGCSVVDIGIVPTPAFYFARSWLGIETGVQVTASHNPAGDNGFKIALGALPITPEEMQELAVWMEGDDVFVSHQLGEIIQRDILPEYLASMDLFLPDLKGLRVVLDCANGTAGLVARKLWSKTGAQVTYLLEEVDGRFPVHPPNPAQDKNLAVLKSAVLAKNADLGVAYDGDADRAAFIDENGFALGNDKVIVLFAVEYLKHGPETIVYDQKCSRVVPDMVLALGGHPVIELSGHTFIKRAFIEHQAVYAGEFSGHHFFRQIGRDDGFFASLRIARLVKESQKSLSMLVQDLPSYPITPDIRLLMSAEDIQKLMLDLEINLASKASIKRTDGIRLEFKSGWALVRPSVTEPLVTLRFEALDVPSLHSIMTVVEAASILLKGKLIYP